MEYSTGHDHIDEHHEHLFNLITMLDKAISTNKRSNLEPIIQFLEHYADEHFKEEEDIMRESDFIGYALHKSEHEKFSSFIKDLRLSYSSNKPTTHIIFFIRKIVDQLIQHITTVDVSLKEL